MSKERCVYLEESQGRRHKSKEVFSCQLFERCIKEKSDAAVAGCDGCKRRLALGSADFTTKWVDPLVILDRRKERTDALRGVLAGTSSFLVCGGPSAKQSPLEQLNGRGLFSLAVNNAAGMSQFRPQAFVCCDPPLKFHHSIWTDPGIMKFVPSIKMRGTRGNLRRKLPDGTFENMQRKVSDCPNVWGYKRETWFTPDDCFFLQDSALWGNLNAGVDRTGLEKTVCTMLIAIRLLRYLGSRRVYLVGTDFWMEKENGYCFDQERTADAVQTNNDQFGVVNKWLCSMAKGGVFERFGLEIFNCCERSGLRAFEYAPFASAVADAKGCCGDTLDLAGWYEPRGRITGGKVVS